MYDSRTLEYLYLEYEAVKERRLWDIVRSKSSPTRYERADFNSSHRDKSISLDFLHYYEDAFIDKYYALPPLLPCFQPSQPHSECGYESPNTNNKVDIDRVKNLRRMGQEKVPNWRNVDTSGDTNHKSGNLLNIPIFPTSNEFSSICEQDVDLEKEEAEGEDDDDDGDTYNIWDITVEDVERIRQFLIQRP
ncbi:hypothetical protein Tco_0169278 [Tanacetum coccineum]